MAKRRIEITVETERIILMGTPPKLIWCEACGASTFEIPIEQAALIAHTTRAGLQAAIETGHLHHWRDTDKRLLICLSSLTNTSS